jgi:predicted nucleic acid-binding protein
MLTVDASVWIADVNEHEPDHAIARAFLDVVRARAVPLVQPTLLLAEVAGSFSRTRNDPAGALGLVLVLRAVPHIVWVGLDEMGGLAAAQLAAAQQLRGADAIYVSVAQIAGTTLVSLDREQRERGAAVVATQTPEEALVALGTP